MKPTAIFVLFFFLFPMGTMAQYLDEHHKVILEEKNASEDSIGKSPEKIRWKDFFKGKFKDYTFGLTLGYANKDWVTDNGDNGRSHEDLWGRENRRLHGLQVGLIAQPCFKFGLGLHTGIIYEMYKSKNHIVKAAGYDNFTEHNFYIPVHVMYRIPIVKKIALSPYLGLGLNWAMVGSYNTKYLENHSDGTHVKLNHRETTLTYGDGQYPERLNYQLEAGLIFTCNRYQIGFTYAHGLTNHKTHYPKRTIQNKLAVTLAVLLGK